MGLFSSTDNVYTVRQPDGRARRFYHRGTHADSGVIAQIFTNEDYSLSRLRRGNEFQSLFRNLKRPLIIDCGANIGASVVWFASHYPGCHIVAFEPDPENYRLLCKNTEGLDVDLRLAAIGSIKGKVSLENPGCGEWGYRTHPDEQGLCDLISITDIIAEKVRDGYTPFITKIDIEGGESHLFETSTGWVADMPMIIIELHDWLLPKMGTSRNFIKCVAKYDRDFVHIRENIFSLKYEPADSQP